jgi:hypothetical protein
MCAAGHRLIGCPTSRPSGLFGMPEARGQHVFICGYSRSGSTMFYNMLRTTVTNRRFMERELPARLAIGASAEDFVTKRPLDIFDIDHIVAANLFRKEIHCLVLIRDIRAIVTSRHKRVPDDYFMGFDRQYFIQGDAATYSNPGILQTHAAIGRAQLRRDIRISVLRYEDILRHPDAVQSKLGRDIGFAYGGSFRDFHKHEVPAGLEAPLNVLRPLDLASIDAWRTVQHRARIKDQFTRCPQLFELLKLYGYETDDRWFDAYREEAMPPPP